jgi:hypothetical protein
MECKCVNFLTKVYRNGVRIMKIMELGSELLPRAREAQAYHSRVP